MLAIETVADANFFISGAMNSHREAWEKIDNIEDYLLRAKKPFNEEELLAAGYDWSANFNYQKGRQKIEDIVLKNVGEVLTATGFIDIQFRRYKKDKDKKKIYGFLQDEFMKEALADAITSSFIETLERDKYFPTWLGKIEYNVFNFGYCPVTRDNFNYLGHANSVRSIAFEDKTKFNSVNGWIAFDVLKADYLWRKLKETAGFSELSDIDLDIGDDDCACDNTFASNGWCLEGLREIFLLALRNQTFHCDEDKKPVPINNWQTVEFCIQKYGESTIIYNVNNIFIAKIYHFDENDNFNEVYVVTNGDIQANISGSFTCQTYKHLLFKKNLGKKRVDEVINIIRDISLISSEYISELRGSGKIIAEDSLRFDIKKCRIEDKLTLMGLLSLTTSNSYSGGEVKVAVGGGFLMAKEGIVIEPQDLKIDLNPHIMSIAQDEKHFDREVEHLDPSLGGELSSRPTKDEVQLKASEISAEKATRAPIKFGTYAAAFYEILVGLGNKEFISKESKDSQEFFFDKIKEFTESLDLDDEEVRDIISCVNILKINPVIKSIAALKEAMQLATSSKARARLQKQYLVALGFSRADANNYIEVEDFGEQVSIASFEDVAFYTTAEVAFYVTQDHITHLNLHFAKCDRVLQGIQGGEDIVKGFTFLANCLSNTEKHVEGIKGSLFYRAKYKDYAQIQQHFIQKLQKLSQIINQMKAQAAQQQQGQQQGPQPDAKTIAQINNDKLKVLEKIKRTNEIKQANMQIKMAEFQAKQDMLKQSAQDKMDIQKEFADLKKQLELVKASVEAAKNLPAPQLQALPAQQAA